MNMERKWVYVSVATVLLALVSVPSVIMIREFNTYFGFLGAWGSGILRPSRDCRLPLPHYTRQKAAAPELKLTKFLLKMPKAKSVGLSADFNMWNAASLPLKKNSGGVWEAMLPLPRGRYKYWFEVDGKVVLDPANGKTDLISGRKASVMAVE